MGAFAEAVRSRDYDAGQGLFDDNVFSFGTYSNKLEDLHALTENQWKPVWSVTRNFHFHLGTVRCEILGDHAWVAAVWQSEGQAGDGEWHDRIGRATLILHWQKEGWKATHSHFSLQPEPPAGQAEPVTDIAA